jgi:4-hydroxy-tetrahydrodipicolinate synthase
MLLVTPYYNKATQRGLIESFRAIADASTKPCILYNVPGRTGCNLTPASAAILAEHPNIVAIKEAAGSVDRVSAIVRRAPDLTVLSGDDGLALPMISVGAKGVISVASNVIPKEMSDFIRLALDDNMASAREMHLKYYELFTNLFVDTNPIAVKEALALMGKIERVFRLPLCETTDEKREVIRKTLASVGLI